MVIARWKPPRSLLFRFGIRWKWHLPTFISPRSWRLSVDFFDRSAGTNKELWNRGTHQCLCRNRKDSRKCGLKERTTTKLQLRIWKRIDKTYNQMFSWHVQNFQNAFPTNRKVTKDISNQFWKFREVNYFFTLCQKVKHGVKKSRSYNQTKSVRCTVFIWSLHKP